MDASIKEHHWDVPAASRPPRLRHRLVRLIGLVAVGSIVGCLELVERTRVEGDNRVGSDRRVLFFVHGHYHLTGLPPETIQSRQGLIQTRLAEVSEYFGEQGVNLSFVESLSNTESDPGLVIRTVNPTCSPGPGTLTSEELAMVALGDTDPERLHLHWIDRYVDGPGGATLFLAGIGLPPDCGSRSPEENNAIIMATDGGPSMITLAHEIGHYFDLSHTSTTGNLMHPTESGRGADPAITAEQRDTIWAVIHDERNHLGFVSFLLDE